MSVKINRLEIENVKRVKAVTLEPDANGLTVIGGKNGQGKTSVLDAIAWALGGNKFKPSEPQYDNSVLPPEIRVVMNNGLVAERRGKNSQLIVTDPTGQKAGQQLLDSFVEALALNLPKFMQASDREKADTLLKILGIGDELLLLETEEKRLYSDRQAIGRIAESKKKYAEGLREYENAPAEPISVSDLIARQQEILAINGENARKRLNRTRLEQEFQIKKIELERLQARVQEMHETMLSMAHDLASAEDETRDLADESTTDLEKNIEDIENINEMVRANQEKARAIREAEDYIAQYNALTDKIDDVRKKRIALLEGANLPLPELRVENGILTYKGRMWDCMSGSEQLRVATAIIRKLNPECGFVLIDKLEQMDTDTMREFGEWLKQEGLQGIATRVTARGDECTIFIEDGRQKEEETIVTSTANKTWTKGVY